MISETANANGFQHTMDSLQFVLTLYSFHTLYIFVKRPYSLGKHLGDLHLQFM